MRPEPLADRVQPGVARLALAGGGAHLDQLVRLQRAVDLGDDLVGEALVADDDGGTELVGLGAQLAAALGGQWWHRGSICKKLFTTENTETTGMNCRVVHHAAIATKSTRTFSVVSVFSVVRRS